MYGDFLTDHENVRAQDVPANLSQPDTTIEDDSLHHRELITAFEWNVELDDILAFDIDSYLVGISNVADAFAQQAEEGIIAHISDITEATGNVVSAKGRDLADAFLDSLDKMDFSFNEDGQPNITIVLHPDQLQRFRGLTLTEEQQARYDAIIAQRREEWDASQHRRELPGFGNGT
jgi:hypothetical protein